MSRKEFLPFSRPSIGQEEIEEVTDSLRSGWITSGPKVQKFESQFASFSGAPFAAAVNSATSGLHIAYLTSGIQPGDEVITTSLTFISTVSMILAAGGKPVLADIDPDTLNIDPEKIEAKITSKTRAIVPVHFAGLPCAMDEILSIAKKHKLQVIEDAAHALGAEYKGKKIGALSDTAVFSFHPIKNITTGEGGMVTTSDEKKYQELCLLRFHGMSKSAWKRYAKGGTPLYSIERLGFKYNMMDLQAALGIHQLKKLPAFNAERARQANIYDKAFSEIPEIRLQKSAPYPHVNSRHLYVIILEKNKLKISRDDFVAELGNMNIGTGIHFTAVHHHPYYSGIFPGADLPAASHVSDHILSLPLYPGLKDEDIQDVMTAVMGLIKKHSKKTAVGIL